MTKPYLGPYFTAEERARKVAEEVEEMVLQHLRDSELQCRDGVATAPPNATKRTPEEMAIQCAHGVRGCTTDEQYIELIEAIEAAIKCAGRM